MNILYAVIPMIISILMVAYMLPRIMLLSLERKLIDGFDQRKVHTSVASRLGGVSFFPAIFISVFFSTLIIALLNGHSTNITIPFSLELEFCALLLLYVVGIGDDIQGVQYAKKFFFQITAAVIIILSGTYVQTFNGLFGLYQVPMYVGAPLSLVLIVFIINTINLIDGIDGLSSMLSILALIAYGAVFAFYGQPINILVCFATMGTLLSFFYVNVFGFRKRSTTKIFMGDAGTIVIGAVLAIMAIKIWNFSVTAGSDNYLIGYTMLIIPSFDVLRVMLERAKSGEGLFLPDRRHFHHKLLDRGFNAHQALMFIVFVCVLFFVLNTFVLASLNINIIFVVDIILWMAIHIAIKRGIKIKK